MAVMQLNLSAPINPLGYGQVGLNVLVNLVDAGHDVALFPIGGVECPAAMAGLVDKARLRSLSYDDDVPSLKIWHQDQLAEHPGRGPRVAYPFFELEPLRPGEAHHLNRMERVLVSSHWAHAVALSSGVDPAKLRVVSPGVDRTVFHHEIRAERFDPEQTVFFTAGKFERRKGHDFLIDCFNKAFSPADSVVLKMLCQNPVLPQHLNEQWRTMAFSSRMGAAGRIQLPPRLPSHGDVARFMASCDVGVFISHAEGWNLELMEAMSVGKPVIATFTTAHTEYCGTDNATLIHTDAEESAFDGYYFRGEGRWPKFGPEQEEQVVEAMREFHRKKQRGEPLFNQAGVETATLFSWKRTAQRITEVLGELF